MRYINTRIKIEFSRKYRVIAYSTFLSLQAGPSFPFPRHPPIFLYFHFHPRSSRQPPSLLKNPVTTFSPFVDPSPDPLPPLTLLASGRTLTRSGHCLSAGPAHNGQDNPKPFDEFSTGIAFLPPRLTTLATKAAGALTLPG